MTNEKAKFFFEEWIGGKASDFISLAQSGSARQNFVARSSDRQFIVTVNENVAENESFFYFSDVFSKLQLNTPQIFRISPDRKMYIQQFLGAQTLSEIIASERVSSRTKSLVKETLQKLHTLQTKTAGAVDYSKTFEYEKYDELPVLNDLFYFKSFIADVLEIPYFKSALLLEFKELVLLLENIEPKGIMIRDFQARNIMVDENDDIFFIDYQSAMEGPLMYDVVSMLFQAKADFPGDFKDEMLNYYFSLWKDAEIIHQLKNSLPPIQLIRFLQVLGAYGFRGLIQRKEHFISSMGQGIRNLSEFSLAWDGMENYPELNKIITALKSENIQRKIREMCADR